MTPIDRLERQLPAAFTDLADERPPDYLIDLLGRTARTRQRPAWAFPGRWFPMSGLASRPALTAVVAVIAIVVVIGGAFILDRSNQSVAAPTATPSITATPTPTAQIDPARLSAELTGAWLAARPGSPISTGPISSIRFGVFGGNPDALDFVGGGTVGRAWDLPAGVEEVEPGLIELTSTGSLGGCAIGDVGRYRWSTADGRWLTLTAIDDPCAVRLAIVPGTWVRSGSEDSRGGPLVSANFEPMFSFTLPEGTWQGQGANGFIAVDRADTTFKVWQDPDAFNDYCDADQGRRVLARGIDPFLTFLREDSGLDVTDQRETTIDGLRAVIVEISGKDDVPPPCWTNTDTGETNLILQWTQNADVGWTWATEIGGVPWPVVVTEVAGHTLVIEAIKGAATLDQATLDSIRFLDALPSSPAS